MARRKKSKQNKKKLRVPFRKGGRKGRRRERLSREILDEQAEGSELPTGERVSGKGELTRYRTIIAEQGEAGEEILREVDESKCLRGRVISAAGLNSEVRAEDGRRYQCTVRRVLRALARDRRNPVATGDRVLLQPTTPSQGDEPAAAGVIERIEPRASTISRKSHGQEHIIAANVDQVLIIVSADDPPLKPNLIDRALVSAEKGGVRSVICINKVDLVNADALHWLAGVYGRLGYEVLLTSATQGRGLKRLRFRLTGCQTALAGQSGVGKSSLLNALQPELGLETREVSEATLKGRHTTRRARLLELDFGGWVVDTPGFRQFALWDVAPGEIEAFFIEFRPFVPLCKFPDCSHTHEAGCGVQLAVEQDLISGHRYESYLRLLEDAED